MSLSSDKARTDVVIRDKLDHARDDVVKAVRSQSKEALLPALESLVQAKILSVYVEDGGLIDKMRRMRTLLEQIDRCIVPEVREKLENRHDTPIPFSAESYRCLRAVLDD